MMRSRLLSLIALAGLALPITGIAQSYLTPEQVMQQNDGAFLVPSHARGAAWASSVQAEMNVAKHPSIVTEPWDPQPDSGLPPPVATAPTDQTATIPAQYSGLDPVTARLLARLAQENSILLSTGRGVPLAQTGPAEVLAVLAMLAATIVTLRRARVLEKFVRDA